jgi:hypothetical protein
MHIGKTTAGVDEHFADLVFGSLYICQLARAIGYRVYADTKVTARHVGVVAYPPDKRRRDLDNILKCVNDALTHLKAIEDDSLIRRAVQEWGEIDRENPRVEVTIKPYARVTP